MTIQTAPELDSTPFGERHAEVYELIYRHRGKDWDAEAADVAELVGARRPGARSLLDVACGTGAHLAAFARLFPRVEGVEPAPAMRALAQRRLPGRRIHDADMRSLALDSTFDAVTCMFTAVAYLPTPTELNAAVATMAAQLAPGGVLVIEPWWFPEAFLDGYVGADLVRTDDRTVARVSHSTRVDRATRLEVRWTVARAGAGGGVSQFTDVEMLTLFTRDEYLAAYAAAGCDAEYRPGWLTGRGLFVGVRRSP